tara:strand:+ start:132 stop:623 length:492 start_codon:yes stop_codon:yes gene_type:complete
MTTVNQYVNELTVDADDLDLVQAKEHATLSELLCDDLWLVRQLHYGVAGAMERQMDYLMNTLIPNTESRIARLNGQTVSREEISVNWAAPTNSEEVHNNDENPAQAIDDAQTFVEGLHKRVRTAAIIYVIHVQAHDEASKILEQFTYQQIKDKAASNRAARAA